MTLKEPGEAHADAEEAWTTFLEELAHGDNPDPPIEVVEVPNYPAFFRKGVTHEVHVSRDYEQGWFLILRPAKHADDKEGRYDVLARVEAFREVHLNADRPAETRHVRLMATIRVLPEAAQEAFWLSRLPSWQRDAYLTVKQEYERLNRERSRAYEAARDGGHPTFLDRAEHEAGRAFLRLELAKAVIFPPRPWGRYPLNHAEEEDLDRRFRAEFGRQS